MRELKFRGKVDGVVTYASTQRPDDLAIFLKAVDPASVCLWTELQDSSGKDIYDTDRLCIHQLFGDKIATVTWGVSRSIHGWLNSETWLVLFDGTDACGPLYPYLKEYSYEVELV